MVGNMNVLVLSDNPEILSRARSIFEIRKIARWTFTSSDDINPKLDFKHIRKDYDLVFSLHCKKIFPKVLTDSMRCINIHPGFNPYNRGVFPHVFSIINGLPAGATIHEMTHEVDNGPIICQDNVAIWSHDTSTTLYQRITEAELQLLDKSLDRILKNDYYSWEPEGTGNYNSMADFKNLCEFKHYEVSNFGNFFNRLRALSHVGYLNAHMDGIKFKLIIDGTYDPN